MAAEAETSGVAEAMRAINQAWLDGRVDNMAPALHPEIVMVFPGFSGEMRGREQLLAGFRDFAVNAKVHEYRDHDHHIDVVGGTAVVTFTYGMLYERAGQRYNVTGRELWIFQKHGAAWLAVWRTMLDLAESPA
jgi:ketosteroid isomerase-like protein